MTKLYQDNRYVSPYYASLNKISYYEFYKPMHGVHPFIVSDK